MCYCSRKISRKLFFRIWFLMLNLISTENLKFRGLLWQGNSPRKIVVKSNNSPNSRPCHNVVKQRYQFQLTIERFCMGTSGKFRLENLQNLFVFFFFGGGGIFWKYFMETWTEIHVRLKQKDIINVILHWLQEYVSVSHKLPAVVLLIHTRNMLLTRAKQSCSKNTSISLF